MSVSQWWWRSDCDVSLCPSSDWRAEKKPHELPEPQGAWARGTEEKHVHSWLDLIQQRLAVLLVSLCESAFALWRGRDPQYTVWRWGSTHCRSLSQDLFRNNSSRRKHLYLNSAFQQCSLQTTIHKRDKQQGPTVQHRELDSISCNKPQWKKRWKRICTYVCTYNWITHEKMFSAWVESTSLDLVW